MDGRHRRRGGGHERRAGQAPVRAACADPPVVASSTERWISNTVSSPVIRKIFSSRSCGQTRLSEPSLARSRRCAPTSTPSPVESRKSTRPGRRPRASAPASTSSMQPLPQPRRGVDVDLATDLEHHVVGRRTGSPATAPSRRSPPLGVDRPVGILPLFARPARRVRRPPDATVRTARVPESARDCRTAPTRPTCCDGCCAGRTGGRTGRCRTSSGCPPGPARPSPWPRLGAGRRCAARLAARGIDAPVATPGRGGRAGPRRRARGRLHRHRLRQVAGLPAAGPVPARRGPAGDRALPVADQGARRRPAARRCGDLDLPDVRPAAYDGDTPHGRAGLGPGARPARAAPTRTCCTGRSCPGTASGRRSCAGCPSWSSTSATPTAACSARTSRRCCAGCAGCCARYGGAAPVFVLASATAGDPATSATRLIGLPVTRGHRGRLAARRRSPSRCGSRRCCPAPRRRPASTADADPALGAARRRPTCWPTRWPTGCARSPSSGPAAGPRWSPTAARRALAESVPGAGRPGRRLPGRLPARGAARAGAGAARRDAARAGRAPTRWSSASTWPGWTRCCWPATRARWRRCGSRPGGPAAPAREALCVLVARDDPLDTYLVHHPEALFGRPVEATVLDPANPYVLAPASVLRRRRAAADRGRPARCSAGDAVRPVLDALVARRSAAPAADRLVLGRRRRGPTSTCAAPAARRSSVVESVDRPAARHGRRRRVPRPGARRRGLPAPGRVLCGGPARPRRRGRLVHAEEPD